MNRQERRRLRLRDPQESGFRLDYKLTIPPGLLRDRNPVTLAGIIQGEDEATFLRNVVSRITETFYPNAAGDHDLVAKLFVGTLCDVLGPASASVRGLLSYGLIEGLGLHIAEGEVTYCPTCSVEKTADNPEPEHRETGSDEPHGDWLTEPVINVLTVKKYGSLYEAEAEHPQAEPEPESQGIDESERDAG